MSSMEIGAVIVGAVIVVLMAGLWGLRSTRVSRQKSEISFDTYLPDRDAASSDSEISFDKDIPPSDRPHGSG